MYQPDILFYAFGFLLFQHILSYILHYPTNEH